jgi:hypothetical protein
MPAATLVLLKHTNMVVRGMAVQKPLVERLNPVTHLTTLWGISSTP